MTVPAALLLASCVVSGFGLTYLSGADLRTEERISWGAFVGLMVVTLTGWLTASTMGHGAPAVGLAAAVSTAAGVAAIAYHRVAFRTEFRNLRDRTRQPLSGGGNPLPLLMVAIPAAFIATRILRLAYRQQLDGGVNAGHLAVFSDWQAHLGYTASFAYANNTDLELITAVGNDLTYHVGINFFASMLIPLGVSLFDALTISAGFCAVFLPVAMYMVGQRIFESRLVAMVGTVLFFCFGGLGWGRIFGDNPDGITYTRDPDNGWWIENPVIGHLFPQRPTLIGFPVVLIVCALLWNARTTRNVRTFAFAGALVGLMPWFNLFGFGVPLVLGASWAVMDSIGRLREGERPDSGWLLYFGPLLALAAPMVLFMLPPDSTDPNQNLDVWYLWVPNQLRLMDPEVWATITNADGSIDVGAALNPANLLPAIGRILWFWFLNFGLFLPLLAMAQLFRGVLPNAIRWASLPIWLFFVIPNFIKPHPWDGNNTHYFVFVLVLGAFPVAALLVRLITEQRSQGAAFIAALAIVPVLATMTLAGILDIQTAASTRGLDANILDGPAVAVGEWSRDNTDPEAVFVIAGSHLHPIPALGGRQVVGGFGGWIYDLGIQDWAVRHDDSRRILSREPGFEQLLDTYDVDYVVMGPYESSPEWRGNPELWQESGAQVVYDFGGYKIYEVGT